MHTKVYETWIDASPEEVWKFHASSKALITLTPPNKRINLLSQNLEVKDGALHVMRFWLLGFLPVVWRARISQVTPPFGFTDQAEKSPFSFWRHRHDFIPDGEGTLLRDQIAYEVPFGKLGKAINRWFVSKDIDRMFEYRHRATKDGLTKKPDPT